MKNLDYKGAKSTRLVLTLLLIALASLFLALGLIEADHWMTVTLSLGIGYPASEVGTKTAEAWRDRKP